MCVCVCVCVCVWVTDIVILHPDKVYFCYCIFSSFFTEKLNYKFTSLTSYNSPISRFSKVFPFPTTKMSTYDG